MASTTFGNEARAAGDVAGGAQRTTSVSQSYYQELTTEANQAFLKKFLPKYGATTKYVTPLAIRPITGCTCGRPP